MMTHVRTSTVVSLALALFSGGEYVKLFVDAVDAKDERLTQATS